MMLDGLIPFGQLTASEFEYVPRLRQFLLASRIHLSQLSHIVFQCIVQFSQSLNLGGLSGDGSLLFVQLFGLKPTRPGQSPRQQ